MGLVEREYENMVNDSLARIVGANIGINNTSPGSVSRTIVEAILSELDVTNYNIAQAYASKSVDDATDEDLDNIAKIFGITRHQATSAIGTVTFSTTEASATDIAIQYNQIVSTKQNSSGVVYEAMVTDPDMYLPAGQLSITVNVTITEPGIVYIPVGVLNIINTSIIGINSVSNQSIISGGTNRETDDNLRIRVKGALSKIGKGTATALENTLKDIVGVNDAIILDMNQGVGTADAVIVTDVIPPSAELIDEINSVIASTKSAGIRIYVVYPTILTINTTITTTGGDDNVVGKAILDYINSLGIGDEYIINQMESAVVVAINDPTIDIATTLPASNITATSTQIIKSGVITVNGVIYGV